MPGIIRLRKVMAVIAAVKYQLDNGNNTISALTVHKYVSVLEQKTGLDILDGFSPTSVDQFFRNHPYHFAMTAVFDERDNHVYYIRKELFKDIVVNMINYFDLKHVDPPGKYPQAILQATGLAEYL